MKLADPEKRQYSYRQTLIFKDGMVMETEWLKSNRTTLVVGKTYAMRLEVNVIPFGPAFSENNLSRLLVNLKYNDEESGVLKEDTAVFTSLGDRFNWQIGLKDPAKRRYTYSITYELKDGFTINQGPFPAQGSELAISTKVPET